MPDVSYGPRILTADEAVRLIADGSVVTLSASGGGILEPDAVLAALADRFDRTGHPNGLTLVHALGVGDRKQRGTNAFAREGMTRRVVGGHWTWSPELMRLARENRVEAYTLPSGAITLLLREIGAHRPGLITRTGLGTFADPRHGGGRFNTACRDDLVELIQLDGEEYLRYKPFRVDVAIIRGDTIDPAGNLSCAREAAQLDVLVAAMAAKASGGVVLAQVGARSDEPLPPSLVHVPGALVDAVVVARDQWQTYASPFDPALCNAAPGSAVTPRFDDPLRTLIALRAAREVQPGTLVNVGFGVSSLVVDVLAMQGRLDDVTLAIEQGHLGGLPVSGDLFGAARGPRATFPSSTQFDLFASGLVDVCCLGMAQVDRAGSVNVSRIDGSIVGPGGFVDIAQNARAAVFCGTFTTRGLRAGVDAEGLHIHREGSIPKFVAAVDEITHSGPLAAREGRRTTYVTERAVFELTPNGVRLTELAPGVDLRRDVLDQMGFEPLVGDVASMDPAIFATAARLTSVVAPDVAVAP